MMTSRLPHPKAGARFRSLRAVVEAADAMAKRPAEQGPPLETIVWAIWHALTPDQREYADKLLRRDWGEAA